MKFGAELSAGWELLKVVYDSGKVYHVFVKKSEGLSAVYYEAKTRNSSLCLRYMPPSNRRNEILALANKG